MKTPFDDTAEYSITLYDAVINTPSMVVVVSFQQALTSPEDEAQSPYQPLVSPLQPPTPY